MSSYKNKMHIFISIISLNPIIQKLLLFLSHVFTETNGNARNDRKRFFITVICQRKETLGDSECMWQKGSGERDNSKNFS